MLALLLLAGLFCMLGLFMADLRGAFAGVFDNAAAAATQVAAKEAEGRFGLPSQLVALTGYGGAPPAPDTKVEASPDLPTPPGREAPPALGMVGKAVAMLKKYWWVAAAIVLGVFLLKRKKKG
jgi:hypothetical protein